MELLFIQKLETLLKKVPKYGCLLCHNLNTDANFNKAIRYIMHMVVVLLLILVLLSKTICCLNCVVFSVVMTWLVRYGWDFKIWKDSSIEQIFTNGLALGPLAFKI